MVNRSNRIRPADVSFALLEEPRSRARWIAGRIAAMEAREIGARLTQVLKVSADLFRGAIPLHIEARGRPLAVDSARLPLVLSRDRATLVHEVLPAAVPAVVAAAERVAGGEFQLLGYPPVRLPRPLRYERDPFTGREWPQRHGLLLDYRTARIGDPKWIWELNRLQHIPLLLSAALLTGDETLIAVAVSDLETWLDQTKPGRGIAWSNGYEPALRSISLALSLDALRGLDVASSQLPDRLLRSLESHIAWVQRYPSLFSSANNHRIGELTGVIVAATLAPELELDDRSHRALSELWTRCEEQFASDGGHREQSFGYGVFSLELLLTVAGVLSSSDESVPPWLDGVQTRALEALDLQLGGDPDPRYGDRDDGGPTLLGGGLGRSGRSARASLAYGLRGERAAELEPSAIWLFGEREAVIAEFPSTPTSGWMQESGVVVLRAGETSVTFDVGPLGYGALAAHGHADALHVTLAHAGVLLVGDPGTGSYFGNSAVRDAFRSTGYHATVVVDGLDQAVAAGPFLWARAPEVETSLVDVQGGTASASHTGYQRLDDPVSHERTVSLLGEGLVLVRDVLTASGAHHYSQRWPLPPGAVVEECAPDRVCARIEDVPLVMTVRCSSVGELGVREGSFEPFEGWWSHALESIEPSPMIACDVSAAGPVEFVVLLAIGDVVSHDDLEKIASHRLAEVSA